MADCSTNHIPEGHEHEPRKVQYRRLSRAIDTSHRASSMPLEKRGTYIARLILVIEACLERLGVTTETHPDLMSSLEGMSCLIHESMSIGTRNYHSVQHVFDVAEGMEDDDPIAVLAALFHDCVYYHVDGGLSDTQYDKLKGVVSYESGTLTTHPGASGGNHLPVYDAQTSTVPRAEEDELLSLVETIFGYRKGQEVNHQNGLNEFLSAVICVRELEPFLSKPVLAQLACCIEATIPFRAKEKETGRTCMEILFEKFTRVNTSFHLELTDQEIIQAVQRAADLGCSDVKNFGTNDVLWFLDNTWSLLPESNEGLRRQYLSSVQQFHFAVYKMWGFFNFLQPEVVFPYFQNVPEPKKLQEMISNARRNLRLGRTYVGAKLLSLSVLSAIAELTGGDAPISLFMGDLPSRHCGMTTTSGQAKKRNSGIHSFKEHIVEEKQPYPDNEMATNIDSDVYEVLSKGRRSETNFDVKQSPMAAYLYSILGDDELMAILSELKLYPMTHENATVLLQRLPRSAVEIISMNIAKMAISRTEKILELVEHL